MSYDTRNEQQESLIKANTPLTKRRKKSRGSKKVNYTLAGASEQRQTYAINDDSRIEDDEEDDELDRLSDSSFDSSTGSSDGSSVSDKMLVRRTPC